MKPDAAEFREEVRAGNISRELPTPSVGSQFLGLLGIHVPLVFKGPSTEWAAANNWPTG